MNNIDYKLVQALDAIIAERSFEKAALALHISQSAVSQRIKQLEQNFAQPILIRSQPPVATDIGQKLLRHYRQVKQLESVLFEKITPKADHDIIKVSIAINADTLASWLIPSLSPLLKKYPLELNLQICNESETQELLKKGEVFSAMSSRSVSFTDCKVQKIADVDYILCATPEFTQKYFADGITSSSLQLAPGVEFDQQDTMHSDYIELHFNLPPGSYPCHKIGSSEAFVNLTLANVAYSILPITQAQPYLESGRLIDLLPDKHLKLPLYWHSWILERGIYKEVSDTIVAYGKQLFHHD